MREIVVFSGNAHTDLAEHICRHLGVELSPTSISRFSNDCLQVQLGSNCRQRDIYIVQPFVPPTQDALMEMLLMIDAARGASAAQITADEEDLLAFYDYPAEHWVHLRTTNPIESTFATVRLRTKVTKGHGSKAAAMGMAFKLIESAQRRRRMVNAPHLVALVRAGATFVNGKLAERPDDRQTADANAMAA